MPTNTGKHVNTIERCISKLSKQNQQGNDNHAIDKYRFWYTRQIQLKTIHELCKTTTEQVTKSSIITTSTCSLTQEYKYK